MAHASVSKAPALTKRLIKELEALGYEYDEAVAMLDESGTREIADFIKQELAEAQAYSNQPTAKTTAIVSEEDNVALVIEVDSKGKTKSIERKDFGSGVGVEAARPLPTVVKQVPTVVEPTASVQKQTKPTASTNELMYDYNLMPVELQRIVDDIALHKLPTTVQLPVVHVVGYNESTSEFIYKLTAGQAAANAYLWLYTTAPRDWQNIPCIVVAPTDTDLLKKYNTQMVGCSKCLPAQADYKLVFPSTIKAVATLDMQQFAKVVAPPASEPKASAKVKAKAAKPAPQPEPTPEKKAPAITDAVLQELATATNHMKKISLVNQILVALGEPKVASKLKKDELQPVVSRLLNQFNVPVAEPTPITKATKTKVEKAPATPAPTKAALIEWYMSAKQLTKAAATKAFAAMDYKWNSSIERKQAAADLGYTA